MDAYETQAYELGKQHAEAAATWVADGNTKAEFIPAVLKMAADGDPALWDYLPKQPNLSGEYADDLTPQRLYEEITGRSAAQRISANEDADGEIMNALCDAYEQGVSDTFEDACVSELRKWLA